MPTKSSGTVKMGTKLNPGAFDCHAHALPDEPFFTLLARDASAPGMVRQWAYEREREIKTGTKPWTDLHMVDEARLLAKAMELWRRQNEGAWRKADRDAAPARPGNLAATTGGSNVG